LIAFEYLQIDLVENRVRSVEKSLNESMNVSIYYKTPMILLDNVAEIIFQKIITLSGPWQLQTLATEIYAKPQ